MSNDNLVRRTQPIYHIIYASTSSDPLVFKVLSLEV